MAAINQDFEMYTGDTTDVIITVCKAGTTEIKDLSGTQVSWRAVRQATCEEITKASPTGIDMSGADQGVVKLVFTHDETKAFRPGRYDHVTVVTDPAGNASTVTVGVMTIKSVF